MTSRFFNRHVGGMLVRNTASSSLSFLVSVSVLWALVTFASLDEVLAAARALERVAAQLAEGRVVKEIWVPGRIVNFIVK